MPSANNRLPDWGDMQGLILSGYPALDHAVYGVYRIQDASQFRRWLARVLQLNLITPALKPPKELEEAGNLNPNVNIALSFTGLRTIVDIDAESHASFGPAFTEGIDGREHRSRILGDVYKNDPASWAWGGQKKPAHVLVMVFARGRQQLNSAMATLGLGPSGMSELQQVPALPTPRHKENRREHFGFADGLSQPILLGTPDAERFSESRHLTALGEVVFGYENADSRIAWGPSLRDCPAFGMNGSYLVFRQFYQDVAAFWRFVFEQTSCHGAVNRTAADALAAKIVGRAQDGTPLVPYASPTDNEFGFDDDPYGSRCPIGAHVRRANPRDSLGENDETVASNRHRILRRGRPYGEPLADLTRDDGKDRGLLFLGLNASFERQFEFVYQNWINNSAFGGLADERDPLIGACDRRTRFTVQGLPAPTCIEGLPAFVKVRGSEYFFLPGIKALKYLAGV